MQVLSLIIIINLSILALARTNNPQFFYSTFLFVICSVLADEAPFDLKGKPQKALLILPPQLTVQNNTTPQPDQNVTESVDNGTDNVLERFKQLQGSVTNVYYISLPDGNVEKLEYIRIPIGQQETQESQTQYPGTPYYQQKFNQYSQSSEQPSPSTQQGNQQTNHQIVTGTNKYSNQANQQQFRVSNLEEPQNTQFQRNLFYSQQNSYNKEVESAEPNQAFAQYNVENSLNKPTSYVASVRFTDVPPVHGPVYAYSTSPLVRIVRFANNVQQ